MPWGEMAGDFLADEEKADDLPRGAGQKSCCSLAGRDKKEPKTSHLRRSSKKNPKKSKPPMAFVTKRQPKSRENQACYGD